MNETNKIAARKIAARAFVEAMRGSLPKAAYAKIRDEAALRLGISIAGAGEFPVFQEFVKPVILQFKMWPHPPVQFGMIS